MLAHHTIMRNLANALAASTAIKTACVTAYGRGVLVQLNAYGVEGLPSVDDCPFLFIFADGENESGNEVAEATFEVIVTAGVASATEGASDKSEVTARTTSANGLTVVGIADKAEDLLIQALAVIAATQCGAVQRKVTISSSGTLDFPLQWSKARINFYEPQTF